MKESVAANWCGCSYCVAEREKKEDMTRAQLEDALAEMRRERDHWRDEYKTLEIAAGLVSDERNDLRARLAQCVTVLKDVQDYFPAFCRVFWEAVLPKVDAALDAQKQA